jgi:hypothetical protein
VRSGGASIHGAYGLSDAVGQFLAGGSFLLVDGFGAAEGGGAVVPPANKVHLPAILR